MSATAERFVFGEDFGQPAQALKAAAEQAAAAEQVALQAVEQAAYARGVSAGRDEATRETERLRSEALARIAAAMEPAIASIDARIEAIEGDALAFFDALARKLSGRLLGEAPLVAVAAAAAEAFGHLRGVPHLAARVHESLVDEVEALLRSMARERGFEGRIIVIGSDDILPGDARLEWADGGVVSERRALDQTLDSVLARAAHGSSTTTGTGEST